MDLSLRGTMHHLRRLPVLYGITWALFIAVLGTLLVSFWAHFRALSDNSIVVLAYLTHCISVLFGSVSASRAGKERGWYYGGLTGLIYALIMVGIGVVIYNTFSMDASGLFRVLLMVLIGAFGGIIGVNTSRDD